MDPSGPDRAGSPDQGSRADGGTIPNTVEARPDVGQYRPLRMLGRVLVGFLVIGILVDGMTAYAYWDQLSLLERAQGGGFVSFDEAERSDSLFLAVGAWQLLTFLVAGILWIVWFRRAYRNVIALGARFPRFRPGWAVGAWFVPFLNLARPKSIMNDIWRASDPDMPGETEAWRLNPVPWFIDLWWALFLVAGILSRASARMEDVEAPEAMTMAGRVGIAESLAWIAAGFLAIKVVNHSSLRQEVRAQRVNP